MRKFVLRCDGQRVSGDPNRVWYAVFEECEPQDWHVAVYHPKDTPADPPDWSCACIGEMEAREFLFDDGYIKDANSQNFLPNDYAPPLELTAGPEVIRALEAARTSLRDTRMGWSENDLNEPYSRTIESINKILNDGYDMRTGECYGPVRPNQKTFGAEGPPA